MGNGDITDVRGQTVTPRQTVAIASWLSRQSTRVGGMAGSVRVLAVILVALFCATGIAAAGTNSATADSKPVLTFGVTTGFLNLDPAKDTLGAQVAIRALSYEALTHLKPNGTPVPALAVSWHYIGMGNKNFELTLRKDARFSNGEQVNAQAVRKWLTYFENTHGPYGSWIAIRSVDTIGKWTVRIHLATPNPKLPALLSDQYPFADVVAPKAIANSSILASQTFGAGPYVLLPSQTVAGDHYTFVPNKFYYDKSKVRFSKVVAKVIGQPSTMLGAIEAGQLQAAYGDQSTADAAAKAGLTLTSALSGTAGMMFLDRNGVLAKPLADLRVRQALNYAIDRKVISQALIGKYGSPTSEPLTIDGYDPKYTNYYPYNPSKAKQLLAAAGYPNGFTFNALSAGYGGNLGDPIAQAVAKYLSAIGVTLKITTAPTAPQWLTGIKSREFSSIQLNFISLPMLQFYAAFLQAPGNINVYNVSDLVLAKLWIKASRGTTKGDFLQQMSQRVTTQAMFMPVFTFDHIWYSRGIKGLEFSSKAAWPLATTWVPSS